MICRLCFRRFLRLRRKNRRKHSRHIIKGAPPCEYDMRSKLTAGGFKHLKSRPALCHSYISLGNCSPAAGAASFPTMRSMPQVPCGSCMCGLLAPVGVAILVVYGAHGAIYVYIYIYALCVAFLTFWSPLSVRNGAPVPWGGSSLAAGSLKTGGRSLYDMPAMFSAVFAPPAQKPPKTSPAYHIGSAPL